MDTFAHLAALAAPLFVLVFAGYGLMRWGHGDRAMAEALNRFVFAFALPALLFRMMSDFSKLPPVDARLLAAFFGSCLLVFVAGRFIGHLLFRLDGVAQSVFALGGVFSNNVLLGVPLAKTTLGDQALPAVAMVLVFNSLTLWTLVTVSVEWARHGTPNLHGFARTAKGVLTNPIVASILSGTVFGLTGLPIPGLLDEPLRLLAQAAAPLALIVLGMGLAEYGIAADWKISATICALKLALQPFVVWLLARGLGLPLLETQVVVMLGSLAVGANVYLMARQFNVLQGPVAASLVLSTALSSLTTPLVLTVVGATGG